MISQRKQTVIKTDHILWIPFLKEINNTVILMVLWNWAIINDEEITMTVQ